MEIITREGLTDRPSRRLSWIAIASMAVLSSHVSIRQQDFLNFSNPKSVQNILRWQQVAAYTMLMKNPKNVTLFQAKIPVAIWQQWEAWAKGRPNISNPQILTAFLYLFLHMPTEVQKLTFNGTEAELIEELRKAGLRQENPPSLSNPSDSTLGVAAIRVVEAHGERRGEKPGTSQPGSRQSASKPGQAKTG